jgi:hypothetical protein
MLLVVFVFTAGSLWRVLLFVLAHVSLAVLMSAAKP